MNITLDSANPAVASQMNVSQLTNIDGSSLYANSGATLLLPNVVSYSMANGTYFKATGTGSVITLAALTSISALSNTFFIEGSGGGRVNLPDLATITNNYVYVSADGAGASNVPSTVNLPALTSFSDTNGTYGYLSATSGGNVIDPLLTTAKGVNITLDQANPAVASQMNVSQLTNIDGSSLFVSSGATLSLPNVASYAAANGTYFQVTGSGSVITLSGLTSVSATTNFLYIFGRSGGRVNLPALATITNNYVDISADGADASNVPSTINLPALTSFSDTTGPYGYLSATSGGDIIDSLLTAAKGVSITLDAANPAVASQMNVSQLTNIDGSTLFANSGATLSLPNIASYAMGNGNYFQATGSGSVIALAGLTSVSAPTSYLYIYGRSGGRVNLPALATITNGYVYVSADGASASNAPSTVNLPSLTSFSDTTGPSGYLSATSGGDVIDPLLTTAKGVNITLDAANPAVASQMNTSQLTNIDGSSLYANSGATLSLPNVASYATANGNYFQATGSGSVITLAGLTSVSAPASFLYIYGLTGGRVNLPDLATITNNYVYVFANGMDASNVPSTVNLPALTSFSDTSGFSGDLLATTGGHVIAGTNIAVAGVQVTFDQTSAFTTSNLTLNGATTLIGTGTFSGSINNQSGIVYPGGNGAAGSLAIGGNFTQGPGGTLDMDLGGTSAGSGYDQVAVTGTANLGGTLNVDLISNFLPAAGNSFPLLTAASVSGQFSSITVPVLGHYVALNPAYSATSVTLSAVQVPGPAVVSTSPTTTVTQPLSSITLTFNKAINASTFSTSQATLTGPNGPIIVNAVNPMAANIYQITFATQTTPGQYHLALGTGITDQAGNQLDQNQSSTANGFNATFTMGLIIVSSPVINGDNPNGLFTAAGQGATAGVQRSMVEDLVYTFNQPATIANANAAFTVIGAGPHPGTAPTALTATAVPGSNGTQWAVRLTGGAAGTLGSIANGEYSITINPGGVVAASDGTTQLAGARTNQFYRLFGDINGAEAVTALDNLQLKKALTNYNPAFDSNADGAVTAIDNLAFKKDLTVAYFGDGFLATI